VENANIAQITAEEVIPALENALHMSETEYIALSNKLFAHGTYFRENYDFELEHLYHFLHTLHAKTPLPFEETNKI
jgi:hypothetical protein